MTDTPGAGAEAGATLRPRVVAVANQKGGVGKTTTAVNLAAALTVLDRRVLLLDLDPQANATSGLGVEQRPGRSAYRALIGEGSLADCVTGTRYARLDLIPSELDLAGAEVEVARGERHLYRLKEALQPLLADGSHDLILIDCPPSLGLLTMNALVAADGLLVPIQCEYYALEGLSVLHRLMMHVRRNGSNPNLVLDGIVMTMFDGRTKLSQQVVDEVAGHFAEQIFQTRIPRTVRLSEAPSFGQPILAYDPRCTGAQAYLDLAREFADRLDAVANVSAGPAVPASPAACASAGPTGQSA